MGILPDGIFLGIEVKKPGGVASKEQLEFHHMANGLGAIALIVDNVDDVIDYFSKRGGFRGSSKNVF